MNFTMGVLREVEEEYENFVDVNDECPKKVVKFPIYHGKCPVEVYQNFTTIGQFDLRIRFDKV